MHRMCAAREGWAEQFGFHPSTIYPYTLVCAPDCPQMVLTVARRHHWSKKLMHRVWRSA